MKNNLFFDWRPTPTSLEKKVTLLDESLRDGIQATGVSLPTLEQKQELIFLMNEIGIDYLDIGYPAASIATTNNIKILIKYIKDHNFTIKPSLAGRTHKDDVLPIIDISQTVGCQIEPLLFIGVSPIRQIVENWNIDILKKLQDAVFNISSARNLFKQTHLKTSLNRTTICLVFNCVFFKILRTAEH